MARAWERGYVGVVSWEESPRANALSCRLRNSGGDSCRKRLMCRRERRRRRGRERRKADMFWTDSDDVFMDNPRLISSCEVTRRRKYRGGLYLMERNGAVRHIISRNVNDLSVCMVKHLLLFNNLYRLHPTAHCL